MMGAGGAADLPACRRIAGATAGTAVLEMAIVLPMLLLFILGLAEFGRLIWTRSTLNYAVQSAARCAALGTSACASAAQIKSVVVAAAPGLRLNADNVAVATLSCGVQVSATLPFQFAAPTFLPYAVVLTASACYPI